MTKPFPTSHIVHVAVHVLVRFSNNIFTVFKIHETYGSYSLQQRYRLILIFRSDEQCHIIRRMSLT